MSELTHALSALIAGVALGYFIPRSRDVLSRVDDAPHADDREERAGAGTLEEHLLATLGVAIFICDERGFIKRANPAAAAFFGFDSQQVAGRAIIEVTGSAEIERGVTEVQTGPPQRLLVKARIGTTLATIRAAFEKLPPGDVLLVLNDETALVESKRLRREFLANVSHELRTPLAGLKLMMETVESDDDAATRAFFFPKISREVERMVELVEHLLQVARSESGRTPVDMQPTNLARLATEVLDPFAMRLAEQSLTLVREIDDVEMRGDAARLAQILVNLLENALRHTPAGGMITVRVQREDDHALIEVIDTGSGIPFKDLPHIFERFYVVDQSRAKEHGGLGVGLAIVKRNVDAMDGKITVESEYGSGSRFAIRFPL